MAEHLVDPDAQPYHPDRLPAKPPLPAGAFFDLDLRIGTVTAVEPFPEMRKPSWKLQVDFGPHVGSLWTSAQITNYQQQDLLGRRVVGAVNLGPKRLPGGFESQFLVLGALEPSGRVLLLEVPEGAPDGAMVS